MCPVRDALSLDRQGFELHRYESAEDDFYSDDTTAHQGLGAAWTRVARRSHRMVPSGCRTASREPVHPKLM
jgi:hypothetical protein